jgi:hypothetical protein
MKGVSDIRTAVSRHCRSASRHQGTPFLEIMALGMEKLRLEREVEGLGKREDRIRKRLAEIRALTESRIGQVQKDDTPGPEAPRHGEQPRARGPWRTMAVEY